MIWSPDESAVARVNANVTDLPVASGKRSPAAIVKDTPVTCPPSEPDDDPTLCKSLLVLTVMPVALPDVAGPNVTPLRVRTCAPAATFTSTRRKTESIVAPFGNTPGTDPMTDIELELEMKL